MIPIQGIVSRSYNPSETAYVMVVCDGSPADLQAGEAEIYEAAVDAPYRSP